MAEDRNPTRRRVLTLVGGATALTVLLPSKWTKPIVESIVVPAHAQATRIVTTIRPTIPYVTFNP